MVLGGVDLGERACVGRTETHQFNRLRENQGPDWDEENEDKNKRERKRVTTVASFYVSLKES